jgi:hypothetical protein
LTFNKRDDWGQRSWERCAPAEDVASRRQMEELNARLKTCVGCKQFVEQRMADLVFMQCKLDKSKSYIEDWKSRRCDKFELKGAGNGR